MKRKLKVYEMPGAASKNTPCIRLQGKWLEELGYKPGQAIMVKESETGLVIEKILQEEQNE